MAITLTEHMHPTNLFWYMNENGLNILEYRTVAI